MCILSKTRYPCKISVTQLGWEPLVESYMITIPEAIPEAHRDIFNKLVEDFNSLIRDLIKWLVQPCLDFIRLQCKLFVTTSPLHLVHSFLNLFTCLLDDLIASQEGDLISQKQVRNHQISQFWSNHHHVLAFLEYNVDPRGVPFLNSVDTGGNHDGKFPAKVRCLSPDSDLWNESGPSQP